MIRLLAHAARRAVAFLAFSMVVCIGASGQALRRDAIHPPPKDAAPPGVFSEEPDEQSQYLITMSPGMETFARDLSVLETNNPAYRSLANEKARKQKIAQEAALLGLDIRRLRHAELSVAGAHWLEFVAVKARFLSDAQMEALTQALWAQMAGKPFMDGYGMEHHPKWEEVRAHFILLKGTRDQAAAAKDWLRRETNTAIVLPLSEELRDASPFAASLADTVAAEAKAYCGPDLKKLQNVVERLLAGVAEGQDASRTHARKVKPSDIKALIARLSGRNADAAGQARNMLELWLKKAVESNLTNPLTARSTDSARPARDLSRKERGEKHD